LTAGLKALSQRQGTTLFMTLLAGWAVVLSRLSGQEDLVIGTPTANRGTREIEGVIGFFVNTLALRLELSGEPSVGELLERVRERALSAQQNQDIPFEQVVEVVQPVRSLAHGPLFQVTFSWQNAPGGELELPGLTLTGAGGAQQASAKYDLSLGLGESGGRVVGGVQYATALYERGTVERYLGYLRRVLEGMAAGPERGIRELEMLPEAERRQVVEEWNVTAAVYPGDRCIHQLFEAQAERTPDAVAVVYEDQRLTYGELNGRANRLAHHLRELGVGPDARVAICLERSLEMVVGLLGVLKAGGAYVPLDPEYPQERLRYTFQDSAPMVVLTYGSLDGVLCALFAELDVPVLDLDLDSPAAKWARRPGSNPEPAEVVPEHLAYVIYTSGSTGRPKGVEVSHRNVTRLFSATDAWFGFGPQDVWTLFHSFAFDFSVWEIWGALLYGGRLVVVARDTARSPEEFYRLLCRERVTILNQTPSAFRQLAAAQSRSSEEHRLRHVIFGGEALEVPTLKPWFARNDDRRTQLINMYGITETTVHVTYRPITAADAERAGASPIGRRIPDLKMYVLDAAGDPVPVGVAGEMYVGGPGVARGYLGRPELTAERFVPDPFTHAPGVRLYRTGDVGRWLPDGTIEYLGRNDHQVKVRGFRIELGEIEAHLAEHPEVREAVVLAREDGAGERRLVAYCVGEGQVDPEALRRHLLERLPEHMVPAAYVPLEALPLTPSGKLDRRALPAPGGEAYARRGYEAPLGEVEEALAQIWAELLGVERVGRHDHFFELGGHSLLGITLIERMRQQGLHADVRALFTTPVLAELARAVGGNSHEVEVPANGIPEGCERIRPEMLPLVELSQAEVDRIVAEVPGGVGNVQDIYPVAPLQEGILFHHLMSHEGDPYLVSSLAAFDSRERLERYLAALQAVIDRHDILRTAVAWEGLREPVQVVWRRVELPVEEVRLDADGGDTAEQLWRWYDPRRYRMDMRRAPLLRVCIAEDPERRRWLMLLLMHHLTGDHESLEVLRHEISAHLQGRASELPSPLPFRNYVAQARLGVRREEHEAFFRGMLEDVAEPTAPYGLLDVWGEGHGIEEARLRVGCDVGARLHTRARAVGVSAASLCHLAWAQVLARLTGRWDVVFGTVLFGRMQGGTGSDRVMGPFINTLPVRIEVGTEAVEAAVRRTHVLLAELLRHEHASLALAQRCSGVPAPTPLFTSLLNYRHGTRSRRFPDPGRPADGTGWVQAEERTNYPVHLAVSDYGEEVLLTAQVVAPVNAARVSPA
ncbi:MAG TPA: amino acid adenylation domain-containing protein, partial [Longimicrobiaceae bacterium]|nr:amino acid adenylation domain-containing protein [Longimicrobiaceae bacterium]